MIFSREQTEADTCRQYVTPLLKLAGWEDDLIAEQRYITAGKIKVVGKKHLRRKGKKPDYILLRTPDYPIAVVEAKSIYKQPSDGLAQAKEYAELLKLKFVYATNGNGIVEFDYITGRQRDILEFPAPDELWHRLSAYKEWDDELAEKILYLNNRANKNFDGKVKRPRYYQQIAIDRACEAIFKGKKRILLTMATGTGKTFVAFQIIWKIWDQHWNLKGDALRPKILYLADRNILIDDPMIKDFAVFEDALHKIKGDPIKSRDLYFTIYQAIARDENKPGLFKEYDRDFFDLIIVDECHRGSARDDSNWREILEYFQPATQIGMTATPKHNDNINTYDYFGDPVYVYSLKQGIEDGFLAPYRVQRVVTNIDAEGLRLPKGTLDIEGHEIPDKHFATRDYERILSVENRNQIVARYLVDYLRENGIYNNKTILFCVDQDHARIMRDLIRELVPDILKEHPDFCERVTCDEGNIGLAHLSHFQDVEKISPGILTSSQMLTTGVDIPTVKNIVLFSTVNSIVTFKQIIGRGTRLREEKDKLWFSILDFTGATRLFADPDFDGPAERLEVDIISEKGEIEDKWVQQLEDEDDDMTSDDYAYGDTRGQRFDGDKDFGISEVPKEGEHVSKYYVDGVEVHIIANSLYQLDSSGNILQTVEYTEYVKDEVRKLYTSASLLRTRWTEEDERLVIIEELLKRGIKLSDLQEITGNRDADPFDLLLHVAYNTPLKTRREKANRVQREYKKFFNQYQDPAREILQLLLDKYAEYGPEQLLTSDVFEVQPINQYGTVIQIFEMFGGPAVAKQALNELYKLLQQD